MASLKKRNGIYYIQWYIGGKERRRTLKTKSLQVAKERLRQFESKQAQGIENPLPTRTPIGEVVAAYVKHIRSFKTPKSAQTDIYYLRRVFGECCPELADTRRRQQGGAVGRANGRKIRQVVPPIEVACFEHITTPMIADYIASVVRETGIKPKTAVRYREILCRMFNWAIDEERVRMPGDANPVRRVRRYKVPAPEIRYLTLPQIDEQLAALADYPQLQAMVAMYIYAGLRREEALWLTVGDIDLKAGTNGMIRVQAKTIDGRFWQPKTGVNRAVPISRALGEYLRRYRPQPTPEGWYFPSPTGRWYDPDNFSRDLRAAQKRAGLQWACLDYRHTFGSQLAQKGVTLLKIASLMGNSPEICRRHYAAMAPESLVRCVDFVNVSSDN